MSDSCRIPCERGTKVRLRPIPAVGPRPNSRDETTIVTRNIEVAREFVLALGSQLTIGASMNVFNPRRREDLVQRLARMNLDLPIFEHALARGDAEAASWSSAAPSGAPEYARWGRTVEELHEGLIFLQQGWERVTPDPLNQPTWMNPQLRTAIVVSSGDENTGQLTFREPSNRNPKGKSFGALVSANEQKSFFDAVSESGAMIDINETWVFLYNARNGFVYSELSVPIIMPGSYIETWRERILFPSFDPRASAFEGAVQDDTRDQNFGFTIGRL
jgi:hypothetical protein